MTIWQQSDGAQSVGVLECTADVTLNRYDCPQLISNLGASGTVTATLPQDAKAGDEVFVFVQAAQAFRIDPGAAGAIYINGAKQTDDKYIESAVIGDFVRLVADGNGDWDASGYQTIEVGYEYLAASVDKRFYTANRDWFIVAWRNTPTVPGSDGGAVTLMIENVASGTAIGSGLDIATGTVNLKGTADTVQAATMHGTQANRKLAQGSSLALDFTGTMTAATGGGGVSLSSWIVQV